jgi:hypothetical protein
MIRQCANPASRRELHYLRNGKIYLFEVSTKTGELLLPIPLAEPVISATFSLRFVIFGSFPSRPAGIAQSETIKTRATGRRHLRAYSLVHSRRDWIHGDFSSRLQRRGFLDKPIEPLRPTSKRSNRAARETKLRSVTVSSFVVGQKAFDRAIHCLRQRNRDTRNLQAIRRRNLHAICMHYLLLHPICPF